jgi:integrase
MTVTKIAGRKKPWRASWTNALGKRQTKHFATQGDAKAHLRTVDTSGGGSPTMSVLELARAHEKWFQGLIKVGTRDQRTLDGYVHIREKLVRADLKFANTKLSDLKTPTVQNFLDAHFERTGNADLTRRARKTLVTWCKFGQRKGNLVTNPAQPCQVETTSRDEEEAAVEIPPKEQLAELLKAAAENPRDDAVIRLLMFSGLRISELLGAADEALTLKTKAGRIKVKERLDSRYVTLGWPKSAKSWREVPVGEATVSAMRVWRMARGMARPFKHGAKMVPGRLFPGLSGEDLLSYYVFRRQVWLPLMRRAGLAGTARDAKNIPRPWVAFSPHALRHVAVSLWIEQGLQPKKVQELAGHATLKLTMDLYGHLWTNETADDELAQASEKLIGG